VNFGQTFVFFLQMVESKKNCAEAEKSIEDARLLVSFVL